MTAGRLVLAAFVALVVSGLCTILLGRKLTARKGAAMRRYVAAAMPVSAGEILRAEDVKYISWPAGDTPEGSFTRTEDVIGRPAIYPIEKGQLILGHLLAAPGAGVGLTTRIAAGMRAIALRSDKVVGVAGFLFPGSRVDVLATYHSYQNPEPITATVLQDAEVVAVGHQLQPDPKGNPESVDVITITAKPEDAERVVLASTQGSIHFVLRNAADRATVDDPPVHLSQFTGGPSGKPARRRETEVRKPKPYVVETILGNKEISTSF